MRDVQEAALRLGVQLLIVRADTESEFNAAFSLSSNRGPGRSWSAPRLSSTAGGSSLCPGSTPSVPAIYEWRDFTEAGGLMSYGTNLADAFRQVGVYTGRILKGEKPADLPVVQSTKFELVINLKTAKALGLDVPPTLLARADEVIE